MGSRSNWCKHYNGTVNDKCQFRTPEEIAAEAAESTRRIELMGKARAAIVAALGGAWHGKKNRSGGSGRVNCPNCAGMLSYSRSANNGHIHAKCSTAGCVAWME